ncbi:uncharacterized protein LOC115227321, partial [Octopus sinensis]|uniref:Uncharacterized protein LOC115227321 n=1 Tax=Octopus sinensis TaxID=2607531 RepID=A0A6P7TQM0_9MOLL
GSSSQGTRPNGIPADVGPAPALPGPVSDHVAPPRAFIDGDALNLNRRVSPDGEESAPNQNNTNKHLISCKNHTILSTLNAAPRSLGRLEELGANAESHGIDIIAVQEHRLYHPDNILKYHQVGSYQLVTSSASKNTVNSTVGGIGFLLSSKASDTLLSIESISPRIMVLEIDGNPKTTLDPMRPSLLSTLKQSERRMLKDFLEEFNLYTSNNSFMKPKGQLWTFESPLGDRAQIDYLIFRKKWRNSVKTRDPTLPLVLSALTTELYQLPLSLVFAHPKKLSLT